VQCSAVESGEGRCQLEGGDWGASRALHSQRCEIFPMTILFVFRALCARLAPHLDPTQPTPLHPTYPTLLDRPALSRRPLARLRRHPVIEGQGCPSQVPIPYAAASHLEWPTMWDKFAPFALSMPIAGDGCLCFFPGRRLPPF